MGEKAQINKWTAEQERSIRSDSGNILVAASAGSGKTAVLTERIIDHVLPKDGEEKKTDLDRMLVITFTEDAANVMKRRIEQKLKQRGEEAESDVSEEIFEQQTKLANANIQTLHSFCNSVCKAYPLESGVSQNAAVITDDEKEALIRACFDEIAEAFYGDMSEGARALRRLAISDKRDDFLYSIVKSLLDKMENDPDGEEWLKKAIEYSSCDFDSNDPGKNKIFALYQEMLIKKLENLKKFYERSSEYFAKTGLTKNRMPKADFNREICEKCIEILKNDTYTPSKKMMFLKDVMSKKTDKLPNETAPKDPEELIDFQDAKEFCQNCLNAYLNKPFESSLPLKIDTADELTKESKMLKKALSCLEQVTLATKKAYEEEKRRTFKIDFSDMEKGALRVLSSRDENGKRIPSPIANVYRGKFTEVYVDEYQDINKVQNEIIRLVSKADVKDCGNLFTVGDLKQSIYGFRGSKPDMFIKQADEYTPVDYRNGGNGLPGDSRGELIRLNKNFRSRKCVIDGANVIFDRIMTPERAKIDYKNDERLIYGATYYDQTPERESPCEFIAHESDHYLAEKVAEVLSNGYSPKDIAVLCRGNNVVLRSVKCLMEAGISAYSAESETNLTECEEIAETLDFLRLAENQKNDTALYSVMRSDLGGFSESEIAKIRENCGEFGATFYDACAIAAKEDGQLGNKLRRFFSQVREISSFAVTEKVSAVIWKIVNINRYYSKCSKYKRENIQRLFYLADDFEENRNYGLYNFVKFIDDRSNTAGWKVMQSKRDAVTVMTIHKSKGLEFPVVILILGAKEAAADSGAEFYGDTFAVKGIGRKSLISYRMMKEICGYYNDEEETRILYVALTRAKEKTICLLKNYRGSGYSNNFALLTKEFFSKDDDLFGFFADNYSLGWEKIVYAGKNAPKDDAGKWVFSEIKIPVQSADDSEKNGENEDIKDAERAEDPTGKGSPEQSSNKEKKDIFEESDEDIPSPTSGIPVKISVTEIKRLRQESELETGEKTILDIRGGDKKQSPFAEPDPEGREELGSAEKGTLLHTCLQYVDFTEAAKIIREASEIGNREYVKEQLGKLVEKTVKGLEISGIFNEKEALTVEKELICRFLMSDEAARIYASDEVKREVPFTMTASWRKIKGDENAPDVTVSVQGVIDCLFKEGDGYVIYDYKSDYIRDKKTEEERRELYGVQLDFYEDAVTKILNKKVKERSLIFLRKC